MSQPVLIGSPSPRTGCEGKLLGGVELGRSHGGRRPASGFARPAAPHPLALVFIFRGEFLSLKENSPLRKSPTRTREEVLKSGGKVGQAGVLAGIQTIRPLWKFNNVSGRIHDTLIRL